MSKSTLKAAGRTRDPFSILAEVGAALCRTVRLRDLLVQMMARAADAMDAEACSVLLLDEASRTLRWEVALGDSTDGLDTLAVPLGEGISGRVAATGVPLRIADAQRDPEWEGRRFDARTGFTTHSVLCVPLRSRERIIGVLQVLNRRTGPFTEADQRLLEGLAGMGGVAIENARFYEDLERKVAERTHELTRALAELRSAQAQLVQSEKMAALGGLVAGVAHEINTPLGAVASTIDVMGRTLTRVGEAVADPAQLPGAQRYLERAASLVEAGRSACQRIATIVRSLRSFSRLDEAERKPADLHECLESTLVIASHLLKSPITLRREFGTLPLVECYPNQLNQVFLNLLVNAAQAIDGPGEITIRTRHRPARTSEDTPSVTVEISDTGCGIAPEHRGRIFDPGFTTKGVRVGTGLGLAISYRIVSDHGGQIEAESEPGRGSTFRIVLPVRGA